MDEFKVPIYLMTGFLESGKTSFLNFTLAQDYFQIDEPTLLILCEEDMTIIITIMQMKYSQAGAKRRQRNIQKKEFMRFWKHFLTIMTSTEWYCVQKVW